MPDHATPHAIEVQDLDFHYGARQALDGINLTIPRHAVTAFIGPSGCGKSTLLRCFNRMNESIAGARVTRGSIRIDGEDIHHPQLDVASLRRRVGMVFQKANPFPTTVRENVLYGLHLLGEKNRHTLEHALERSLRDASLWSEVKDRLDDSPSSLSGGQQQRLCIARTLAVEPEILLMDEPCSALDPIATAKIEELIQNLCDPYTVVIVTHSMQQAARIADQTAFFHLGKLVECDETAIIFSKPAKKQTEDYNTGRFG